MCDGEEMYELKDRVKMLEARLSALEGHLGVYSIYKPESYEVVKSPTEPTQEAK